MDYDRGEVRYCLEGMVARLGLSRATVSRHIAYLREMGSLVWVERGSRVNARRAQGQAGYARTATVYGAVIPAAYDHALGHTIVGTGYTARIVIDQRATGPVPAEPVEAAGNSPVDNRSSSSRETPSRTGVKEVGQLKIVAGCNYTSRRSASQSRARTSHQSTPINGRRRTATDVRHAERTVRLVRALVSWTQRVSLRRLEYVLRPLTDRGLDALNIAAELTAMCSGMRWRPQRPDVFISQRLTAVAAYDQQLAHAAEPALTVGDHAVEPMDNPEWAACMRLKQRLESEAAAARPRTDGDRIAARATWNNWPAVADHYAEDPDDALDLYGLRLCQYAVAQAARVQGPGLV
ncbi:hypothetical protein [Streptomyces chartreusis]|uniref:hypothetical protein n=1 Tax=Streptomyces chartreusis TaxID=1969 RepID=UPI00378E3103